MIQMQTNLDVADNRELAILKAFEPNLSRNSYWRQGKIMSLVENVGLLDLSK